MTNNSPSTPSDSGKTAAPNYKPAALKLTALTALITETVSAPVTVTDAGQEKVDKGEVPTTTSNLVVITLNAETASADVNAGPITDVLKLIRGGLGGLTAVTARSLMREGDGVYSSGVHS